MKKKICQTKKTKATGLLPKALRTCHYLSKSATVGLIFFKTFCVSKTNNTTADMELRPIFIVESFE